MNGVVRREKKTLLAKIAEKIKADPLPRGQAEITLDVLRDEARIDCDDEAVIASRRDALKTARYGNNDVIKKGGTDHGQSFRKQR